MKTETIDVDERFGQEYAGHYVFSEITWAKRNRIIQKYTKYHPATGQVLGSDFLAIQAETIMASLHGQPASKPLTLEKLLSETENGIPIDLGETISKVVNKLNNVGHADLRFLLEHLEEENRTQLLATLGYVKSSDGPSQNSESNQLKKCINS